MEEKLVKEIKNNVGYLWINRPDKKNALDSDVWFGLPDIINELDNDNEVRCIVIAGKGDGFSAGVDITMFMSDFQINEDMSSTPVDRKKLKNQIQKMQDAFTALSKTSVPVIALAHGHCIGGATALVSACDIRIATKDAKFSIGETKLGLVADVGILQRMPKIVSKGDLRELAYTGRIFDGEYAEKIRFVSSTYKNFDELYSAGVELAEEIASNAANIVQGTKQVLDKGEDLTTEQALDFVQLWNTSFLITEDLREGVTAFMEKRKPKFN
jgi:enoyl-CoA hydratase